MTLLRDVDAPAASCSVLVVEDDVDVQQLLRRHLQRLGWEVRVVGTGQEAITEAFARPPHLLVVDVQLPDIDGRDVVRTLRRSPPTQHCRVVVTTVLDPHELEELALDDQLPKPFSRADVRRVLGVPAAPPAASPAHDLEQERS